MSFYDLNIIFLKFLWICRNLKTLVIFVCMIDLSVCVQASDGMDCCKDFGLKVPEKNCLLDWETFVSSVANVTWRGVYAINSETLPTPGWKLSVRWDVLADHTVRRIMAVWERPEHYCFSVNTVFASGACTGTAKLESLGEGEDAPWNRITRTDRFASTDPDKYILFAYCYNDDLKCNGHCETGLIVVFVKDQRPDTDGDGHPDGDMILDGIPWCDIENKLNECFDATLGSNTTYTQLQWTWRGPNECRIGDQN